MRTRNSPVRLGGRMTGNKNSSTGKVIRKKTGAAKKAAVASNLAQKSARQKERRAEKRAAAAYASANGVRKPHAQIRGK